jgi:hypothetical protein
MPEADDFPIEAEGVCDGKCIDRLLSALAGGTFGAGSGGGGERRDRVIPAFADCRALRRW